MMGRPYLLIAVAILALAWSSTALAELPLPLRATAEENNQAETLSRDEALALMESQDWADRARGLSALSPLPDDHSLLAKLARGDESDAVRSAAMMALARLGDEEATGTLMGLLTSDQAETRASAALALVREAPTIDEETWKAIDLQLLEPELRRWAEGRLALEQLRLLRQEERDAIQRLRAIGEDPCLAKLAKEQALRPEVLLEEARAERFWREGRIGRVVDELTHLKLALERLPMIESLAHQCENQESPIDPVIVDPGLDPDGFYVGSGEAERLYLTLISEGGYDSNAFATRPGLVVNEPGPWEGHPVDQVEYDLSFNNSARLAYLKTFGEVAYSRLRARGLRDRGDHLYIVGEGGHRGRYRFGQQAGAWGHLGVAADRFIDTLSRLRGALDVSAGELGPALEHDPLRFPTEGALRANANLAWTQYERLPGDEYPGLPSADLTFDLDGGAQLMDPRVTPPEEWFTNASLRGRKFYPLDDLRLGWGAHLGGRVSEGDWGAGLVLGISGETIHQDLDGQEVLFELGFGAGLGIPLGGEAATTSLYGQEVEIDRGLTWAPELRARLYLDELDSYRPHARYRFTLFLERTLSLVGRYGWIAPTTQGGASFWVTGPADERFGEVSLKALYADYDLGDSRFLASDSPAKATYSALVSALQFPIPVDDFFLISFRGEAMLLSDSLRYDGDLKLAFRALARVEIMGDLFHF